MSDLQQQRYNKLGKNSSGERTYVLSVYFMSAVSYIIPCHLKSQWYPAGFSANQ